jgi:Ca2+-binding RTX toxin-like protein
MRGEGGGDTFVVDNGTATGGDVVVGGAGYDTVIADESVAATGLHLVLFPDGTPITAAVNQMENTSAAMGVECVVGGKGSDLIDASMLGPTEGIAIFGDAGNDTFINGAGQDYFDGQADADKLIYAGLSSNYHVTASASGDSFSVQDLTTGVIDTIYNIETLRFSDGDFAPSALDAPVNQTLIGTAGNDTLTGGAGADQLLGGKDTDFLSVDADDTLIDGGDGFDYVYLDSSKSYGATFKVAGTNVEYVGGTGADDVIDASGVTYHTVLGGSYGKDILIGGSGADSLIGSVGDDTLTGGAGADWFMFWGADGADTITDFRSDEGDRIDLTNITTIHGIGDLIWVDDAAGNAVISQAGSLDNSITLLDVHAASLTANDFLFAF